MKNESPARRLTAVYEARFPEFKTRVTFASQRVPKRSETGTFTPIPAPRSSCVVLLLTPEELVKLEEMKPRKGRT